MIGMLVFTMEYRIHDVSATVHLQGLESIFLLVGGLNAVSAMGIAVVHYHGVDPRLWVKQAKEDDSDIDYEKRKASRVFKKIFYHHQKNQQ